MSLNPLYFSYCESCDQSKKEHKARWQAERTEMQPVLATFLNHSHPCCYHPVHSLPPAI